MPFEFYRSAATDSSVLKIPTLGLDLAVRLRSDLTGGDLTILETINAPGFGPPLHRHHETEIFCVLEGRYLYEVNGKRFEASEGDVVSVPGGDAHAFVNITGKPARQIVLMLPRHGRANIFHTTRRASGQGKTAAGCSECIWRAVGRGVPRAAPLSAKLAGGLVQIVSRIHTDRHPAVASHQQVSANKRRQIAVEHAVHVTELDLGAMVLDDAVGLKHVRPDL